MKQQIDSLQDKTQGEISHVTLTAKGVSDCDKTADKYSPQTKPELGATSASIAMDEKQGSFIRDKLRTFYLIGAIFLTGCRTPDFIKELPRDTYNSILRSEQKTNYINYSYYVKEEKRDENRNY